MSYELSFSPEFFYDTNEPYDDDKEYPISRPKTVWQAIMSISDDYRNEIAKEVFGLKSKKDQRLLMAEAIMEKIQETNTCTNIDTPVEVWIDEKGEYRIKVF